MSCALFRLLMHGKIKITYFYNKKIYFIIKYKNINKSFFKNGENILI